MYDFLLLEVWNRSGRTALICGLKDEVLVYEKLKRYREYSLYRSILLW